MKLSIIIPIYNVEKYIERTLRSVLNQDIDKSECEIIIINDGSPDSSEEIVTQIINEGYEIKLFNQSNQGLSAARNSGIKKAKGDYLWFVDSDDWIKDNCLSSLFKCMDGCVDEIVIGAATVSDDGNNIQGEINMYPRFHNEKLDGKSCWKNKICHIATAQLAIYRSGFLRENNLSFIPGIFHEDFDFCIKASYLSKKTLYLSEIYYYLRHNPNSITRSINPKKSFDYIIVAQSLKRFLDKYVDESDISILFHYYISMAINNSFDNICKSSSEVIFEYESYLKNNGEILDSLVKSKKNKYVLEGILFKMMKGRYIAIYNLLSYIPSLFRQNVYR